MPTCDSDGVPLWIDRQEGALLEEVLLIGTRDWGNTSGQNPVGSKVGNEGSLLLAESGGGLIRFTKREKI